MTSSSSASIMPHVGPTSNRTQNKSESSERHNKIRIKNRRKMYLDRHPSYFKSPDLELLDPLLYDRCVRRFQSAAEREADGRSKGYSRVLEADLLRSEARLAAVRPSIDVSVPSISYVRGSNGEVLPEDPDEIPKSKEDGFERWKYEVTMRFLKGEDPDFPYAEVDESDDWDVIEREEEEERYFEAEIPTWAEETTGGETGVQDY